jgi:hypothetical protein
MTYTDIKNKVYFLSKTDSTNFPIADLTLLANNALDRVTSLILQSDGRWQFDDSNYTDLPIGTTALVSGQKDYSIATSQIEVQRVEVKDENGDWRLLTPIDKSEINIAMDEWMLENGQPMFYDKVGQSILLYPTPSYSQSASLKVYFSRIPSYFATNDTTKTPGFNPLFHDLIPLWVSYEYGLANGRANTDRILLEIQKKESELMDSYLKRSKDEPLKVRTAHRNPR